MPYKPKKPCAYPGCPRLINERYCDEHRKLMNAQYDARYRDRGAREFYISHEWRSLRRNFLIDHPFCEECRRNGKLTKATVVDHVIPIKQGGATLDEDNLQALCAACHSRKSIAEGSRYGKK